LFIVFGIGRVKIIAWNNLGFINLNFGIAKGDGQFLGTAKKLFNQNKSFNSENVINVRGLGIVFFQEEETQKIVDLWQHSPQLVAEVLDRCRLYQGNSEIKVALRWCQIATIMNPDEADAWYLLGIIYTRNELWVEATDAFLRAVSLNNLSVSGKSNPHLKSGIIYQWRLNQLENSLGAYNQAIAISEFAQLSELAEAYYRRGEVLMWQNFSPEVYQPDFQTAVILDPENVQARIMLATTNFELDGNLQAAEEEIFRALEIDPTYAAAYLKLGDMYFRVGLMEEATSAYKTAMALDPGLEIDIFSRQKSLMDN
jgi:tetratricopeptide (TPR) repeat protein